MALPTVSSNTMQLFDQSVLALQQFCLDQKVGNECTDFDKYRGNEAMQDQSIRQILHMEMHCLNRQDQTKFEGFTQR